MRKIIAGLFMSLDGVVESPDQWQMSYFNDEMGAEVDGMMASADAMLLGRRTYQEFAASFGEQTGENADYMNGTPKFVVSNTLTAAGWQNSTLIRGNITEEITKLKQQPGGNINISGSAMLVRSLLRDGLLDELYLLMHPIVVGSGKRLFEEGGERVALKLVDAKTFRTGVLALTYIPAGT